MIRPLAAVAAVLVVSTALAAAAPPPPSAVTGASAVLVRISIPGHDPVSVGALEWPTSTSADVQSFQYPADGSIVSTGRSRATTFAAPGAATTTNAFAEVIVLSLFGGDVVAAQVTASASASASSRTTGADVAASQVQGLRVHGQDVGVAPGSTASLGDWGTVSVLSESSGVRKAGPPRAQASVTGLRVLLTADHGGLPSGSEILVGSVQATAVADLSVAAPSRPRNAPRTPGRPSTLRPTVPAPAPEPESGGEVAGGPVRVAPEVTARLSAEGHVFPVYGPASYGDSFGAPRPDVEGGWHHGEDIFAPAGTPLLAVADGTLHTIGFNRLGGYRLWLRDDEGDEFYYAHLSAYSPLAVEGNRVAAGDVIGFVGATGDAYGGTPHLHFEIHPASMASLGYNGVVAPYPILLAWQRADDIAFSAGRVYIAAGRGGSTLPPPGAVLLEARDIGTTSGLVPGALERALQR